MAFHKALDTCPVCKKESRFSFLKDYQNTYGTFTLYECRQCSVQFWNPLKNPGNQWYEEESGYQRDEITAKPKITKGAQTLFLKEHPRLQGKKILDVGCGTGEFLGGAQALGAECWGVDFDRTAVSLAQEHFGLKNVYALSIEEFFAKIQVPEFDYICSFEVIEHVQDPLEFVRLLADHVKPGGTIVMSTPSRERIFPNLYSLDFPPHHLTRWNEEALENLFRRFAFKLVSVRYADQLLSLFQVMNSRLRFGLARKAAGVCAAQAPVSFRGRVFLLLGWAKDILLGGFPAISLWLWGKITGQKNGDMVAEFKNV